MLVTIAHAVPPQFHHGMMELDLDAPAYYEAFRYWSTASYERVLDDAFRICNVDDPSMLGPELRDYADEVRDYRKLGNRSLSVGDVVILTGSDATSAWRCLSLGWEHLEEVPDVHLTEDEAVNSAARVAHEYLAVEGIAPHADRRERG